MNVNSIEVLGVYRPLIPQETYLEQLEYGTDEATKKYFDQLVLIEALAHDAGGQVSLMQVGQQPQERPDPGYFLCAYDEGLLSRDGERFLQRDLNCVQGTGDLRFAFYLQFYDSSRPLSTPYGEVTCPTVTDAPVRLMMLMPYTVQT